MLKDILYVWIIYIATNVLYQCISCASVDNVAKTPYTSSEDSLYHKIHPIRRLYCSSAPAGSAISSRTGANAIKETLCKRVCKRVNTH